MFEFLQATPIRQTYCPRLESLNCVWDFKAQLPAVNVLHRCCKTARSILSHNLGNPPVIFNFVKFHIRVVVKTLHTTGPLDLGIPKCPRYFCQSTLQHRAFTPSPEHPIVP